MFTREEIMMLQEASPPEFFRLLYEKTGSECFLDGTRLIAYIADLLNAPASFKQRLRYAIMSNVQQYVIREPQRVLDMARMQQIVQNVQLQTGMSDEAAEEIVCLFAYATGRWLTYTLKQVYYPILRPVKVSGKYGYADGENNVVIPPVYDRAKPFAHDRAKVCKKNKFGFIDRAGNEVIALIYDRANDFAGNVTEVILNGEKMIIDLNGQRIRED